MRYNDQQLLALSQLFLDIAKGMYLGAVAFQAVSTGFWLAYSIQLVSIGSLCLILSLKLLEIKTTKRLE